VVAHAGSGQVLLVLPEYNPDQAQALLAEIQERVKVEVYYPPSAGNSHSSTAGVITQGIGRSLSEGARLRTGLAILNGQPAAQDLIKQARQALEG
jgi:GGDEF domain-containing protein